MRKWMLLLCFIYVTSAFPVQAAPEYAQWGTLAVKEAQQKYDADILDYQYLGRKRVAPHRSEERFKLWIRDREGKQFGVLVYIQFDPANDTLHTITFHETER